MRSNTITKHINTKTKLEQKHIGVETDSIRSPNVSYSICNFYGAGNERCFKQITALHTERFRFFVGEGEGQICFGRKC